MSRGYWGGVMLFSLVISGAAGWYLWTSLQEKSTVTAPLNQVSKGWVEEEKKPEAAKPDMPITKSVPVPGQPTEAAPAEKVEPTPAAPATNKRKILFKIRSAAKKVDIVGDFNKWHRKPMTKKDGVWSVTVELDPGTYEYRFIVDGKKTKDPNNKSIRNGNSVITVKSPG